MGIVIVGIDLGKNSCSVAGLDSSGRVVLRRRVRRASLEGLIGGLERCVVAMEACGGAHHLGRVFAAHGHEVRLMPPEYVRPYVKGQKNDDLDAEAIAEAATRGTMRFVAVKKVEQSDVQALHRARERLVSERTALINHLRALLLERGITAPQGRAKLAAALLHLADDEGLAGLSPRIQALVEDLRAEWRGLDERITAFDAEFVAMTRSDEAARRLATVPGIGTINATALAAAVGDASGFRRGRDLAAWLGLTPRQMTTGGRPRLLGVSKRGNSYLRKKLLHGARAALPSLATRETPLGRWARALLLRVHKNVAVVALANKLARVVWALLAHGGVYEAGREATA